MTENRPLAPELMEKGPAEKVRNPFIVNYCRTLVENTDPDLDDDTRKKLVEQMYDLYESMLGTKMIEALPEEIRKEYLKDAEDLYKLDYDKIAHYFDKNVQDHDRIMKETLKEFTGVFISNRKEMVKKAEAPEAPAAEE